MSESPFTRIPCCSATPGADAHCPLCDGRGYAWQCGVCGHREWTREAPSYCRECRRRERLASAARTAEGLRGGGVREAGRQGRLFE